MCDWGKGAGGEERCSSIHCLGGVDGRMGMTWRKQHHPGKWIMDLGIGGLGNVSHDTKGGWGSDMCCVHFIGR